MVQLRIDGDGPLLSGGGLRLYHGGAGKLSRGSNHFRMPVRISKRTGTISRGSMAHAGVAEIQGNKAS